MRQASKNHSENILRRLDLPVVRRLEGLLQGDYKSPARGDGLDLADLREYQFHDDVRRIDWNATARLDTPFVRDYIEDREIPVWFVLDMSPSMAFEGVSVSKHTVLTEFTTLMCRLMLGRGNRAGAMIFSGKVDRTIPSRGGRQQLLHILDAVANYRPTSGATDLAQVLKDTASIVRRRSLIFVVSDFISPPGWEKALNRLAMRHDVVAVRLTDPLETRLPDVGFLTFQDAESGEQMFVDTHNRGFRARFAAAADARDASLREAFERSGVDVMELATEDDVADALVRFAEMRKHSLKKVGMKWLENITWQRVWGLVPSISFDWPVVLWALLLVPLLVAVYVFLISRRKKSAFRYSNLALVKEAAEGPSWRRHVPPALMLMAFTVLLLAIARPSAEVSLPSRVATVMLVMDVSGSMRATDVAPSRIIAAETAAKAYIKQQPKDVRIGIVAFAATALLVQSPTTDHTALTSAIDRFELQRGTAVGSGIMVGMSTLFPQDNFPINQFNSQNFGGYGRWGGYDFRERYGGVALGERAKAPPKKHVPVEPGSYKNAVMIVLTDGQTNAGYDPVEAARIASEYGVRVYTVGFGTAKGNIVGFGGFSMRAQLDETALKKVADMTRAKYFHATSSEDLKAVYDVLSRQLVVELREMEITSFFAAMSALLMLMAAGLSLAWYHRIF